MRRVTMKPPKMLMPAMKTESAVSEISPPIGEADRKFAAERDREANGGSPVVGK